MISKIFLLKKSLIFLFYLLTIFTVDNTFATPKAQQIPLSFSENIFLKKRALRFDEITHDLQRYKWSLDSDPRLLIVYCEAILETEAALPEEMKNSSDVSNKFAQAYLMLLRGKTRDSNLLFDELVNTQGGEVFGFVGLLEQSLFTGNITSLGQVLEKLKSSFSDDSHIPIWILPYYEATYNLKMGRYKDVTNILQMAKINKSLSKYTIEQFEIAIAIPQNQFAEARKILKHMGSNGDADQNSILNEADILAAELGFPASSMFLSRKMREYPEMWLVKKAFINHSLEAIHFDQKLSIPYLNMLSELEQKRNFDVNLKLNLASLLFYTGDPIKGLLSKKLRDEIKPLEDFVNYDLLIAKLSLRSTETEKQFYTMRYLDIAKEKAPLNISVLWLSYQIAEMNKKYDECMENLNQILFVDPFNVDALVAKAKTYNKLGEIKEAKNLAHKMLYEKNKRKISIDLRKELQNVLQETS
ncbi:hypothetical protein CPter91_3018 [Collimonas pratensis]|uniref:Tetratricopeptide repeat family protein n=2 Tax=Collimonas pratensis TaxID=279113 RepID=A0A127Q5M1_9BURK|nr:hypothetical protein CPter91_3018 [Collimonas pratensis]